MFKKLFQDAESKNRFCRVTGATLAVFGCAVAAIAVFMLSGSNRIMWSSIGFLLIVAGAALVVCAYYLFPGKPEKRDYRSATIKLTVTAVLLGLTALSKLFTVNIAVFGSSGMRVGIGGVFTSFPAMLFGPLYGGIASAASDILGCLISPIGAYNPLFTLTAFAGGFMKGVIWMLLGKANTKKLRIGIASCLTVVLMTGVAFYISFAADGLGGGVIASADEVPTKGIVTSEDKSFLTALITDRERATNTYTLVSVANEENVVIPDSLKINGAAVKLAVGSTAFTNCDRIKTIRLPETLASLSLDSLKGRDITVYLDPNSKYINELKEAGIGYETVADAEAVKLELDSESNGRFTFVSDMKYEKRVAGYMNFTSFGLTLTGLLGMLMLAAELVWTRYRSRKERSTETFGVRIFAMLVVAEILVTTLNTVILREITYASTWSGYPFMILWIPRAAEGVIISVIQAYLVTLLYSSLKEKLHFGHK